MAVRRPQRAGHRTGVPEHAGRMDYVPPRPVPALTFGLVPTACPTGAPSSIRSRRAFGHAEEGNQPHVAYPPHEPSGTPALRYLAILSAARDFGVSAAEIERVARRLDPVPTTPRELAEALADTLTHASKA